MPPRHRLLVAGLVVLLAGCSSGAGPAPEASRTTRTSPVPTTSAAAPTTAAGRAAYRLGAPRPIDPRAGRETSGIQVSSRDSQVAFVVDDATGGDSVGVVRTDGSYVGRVQVRGMAASNAEALAGGPCETGAAQRCLFVGDIGDHVGRSDITVWRLAEPDPAALPDRPVPAVAWRYTYPDGPFDAEAMYLDEQGRLVLITKRPAGRKGEAVARVYRGEPGGGALRYLATLRLPAPPAPLRSLVVGDLVTDAAAVPGRVAVLTYDQLVVFTAPLPDMDSATLADWPAAAVAVTPFRQAEAVSAAPSGGSPCGFVVAGEGSKSRPGQLARVTCSTG